MNTIREKGEQLLQLINSMLDTAKLESGSLEVHRAQLPDGGWVAVKIQKTGIEGRIEADLSILAALAELAEDVAYIAKYFGGDSDIDAQGRVLMPALLRNSSTVRCAAEPSSGEV